MTLRRLHRLNALVLGLFLVAHMLNHAVLVVGIEAHEAVMEAMRMVYRIVPVEVALLTLLAVQIGLGLVLVWRRGRPQGGWAWAQVLSGLYLFVFQIQHVPAVLAARLMPDVPDTDVHFAAAVLSEPGFAIYFAPYYALAVLALFTHVAAALRFARWPREAHAGHFALPVLGFALGLLVVLVLMGVIGEYGLPPEYAGYLDKFRWRSQ